MSLTIFSISCKCSPNQGFLCEKCWPKINRTECQEIAEGLLPKYLEEHQDYHSMHGIAKWVMGQLSRDESYTVIDNVTHHLQELVFQRYK